MIILATILSGLSLLKSLLFLIHLRSPFGWMIWFPKLTVEGYSPCWVIMGAAGAVIGWASGAFWAVPMGIIGSGTMAWYLWRCTRNLKGFEKAFGAE
jgi:hypothetical protein